MMSASVNDSKSPQQYHVCPVGIFLYHSNLYLGLSARPFSGPNVLGLPHHVISQPKQTLLVSSVIVEVIFLLLYNETGERTKERAEQNHVG